MFLLKWWGIEWTYLEKCWKNITTDGRLKSSSNSDGDTSIISDSGSYLILFWLLPNLPKQLFGM
jgi:hypothetical protein